MQHGKRTPSRYVFVAVVGALIVGAVSTPANKVERQAFNHWGKTSSELRTMADFTWGRTMADFTWGRALAGFEWGRALAGFDWT